MLTIHNILTRKTEFKRIFAIPKKYVSVVKKSASSPYSSRKATIGSSAAALTAGR